MAGSQSRLILLSGLFAALPLHGQQPDSLKPWPQNPSPMRETARRHERILQQTQAGLHFEIGALLPRPVKVFLPEKSRKARRLDVLLHFHGADFITQYAAVRHRRPLLATTINLGSGARVYGRAFEDSAAFPALLRALQDSLQARLGRPVPWQHVILSGFSAGYGAIRRIISTPQHAARLDAILLLDGIHAGYVPEYRVLAEGGEIQAADLEAFVRFAAGTAAPNARQRFLITHSEIFPGTFVSTTEATDFILQKLGMSRRPVLKWGPLGMQQISEARRHHFAVLGFAGNTGPDHTDHLHALYHFLNELAR
ncbi:MAG: hypothetical protein ONB48_10155 [candidate division KSB1 bacterium]|nr:hypothetical protein [candidate division KSB1 bacterium]MDZ7273850.1 hypothetical protein [candidate division KSB1 bacterium]MDZ7286006.1 hypothetical protein [candidate division KSB1 bacterium]MDZ7299038.1 hypothetical protein [candidate division KSB1 bacterium]MDZ7307991.1 hypothetical protein [candidate division KSB1 bacterium]